MLARVRPDTSVTRHATPAMTDMKPITDYNTALLYATASLNRREKPSHGGRNRNLPTEP